VLSPFLINPWLNDVITAGLYAAPTSSVIVGTPARDMDLGVPI